MESGSRARGITPRPTLYKPHLSASLRKRASCTISISSRQLQPSQFPRTGIPEIAMVGRSNVGKSSLINALVKQKIARTSAAPGKTRLVNYYLIESLIPNLKSLYLVDLPGYGYARGGVESVEAFEQLTQAYFDPSTREQRRVAGVLQLVDSRHPDLPAGRGRLCLAARRAGADRDRGDEDRQAEPIGAGAHAAHAEGQLRLPCPAGLGVRRATGSTRSGRLIRQWGDEPVRFQFQI